MILGHGSTEIVYSLSSQNTARKETKKFIWTIENSQVRRQMIEYEKPKRGHPGQRTSRTEDIQDKGHPVQRTPRTEDIQNRKRPGQRTADTII